MLRGARISGNSFQNAMIHGSSATPYEPHLMLFVTSANLVIVQKSRNTRAGSLLSQTESFARAISHEPELEPDALV